MTRKTPFFEEWSWFKVNNLGLTLVTNLKFYSVTKGLKLKIRKFLGLIPTFVEVTGEILVGGPFAPWIELKKYEKCFLFHLIFIFLSSPHFYPIGHCFTGWSKINLTVYDVIIYLNKNRITHFVWYLEKGKRYDIETVIRMLLVCTHMSSVYYSYVFVCHPYVLVCHPYVTLCKGMSSVCHPYVLACHPCSDINSLYTVYIWLCKTFFVLTNK